MLIGEYLHTLDEKKRISLPAKFRKELGRQLVVTRGLENSLFVYSRKGWERIAAKLSELGMGSAPSRDFSRFMFAGAAEVEVDQAGRMLLPDHLRNFAGLRTKVVLAGVHSRVEIWDPGKWQDYRKKIEGEADALAEKLGDVGAL